MAIDHPLSAPPTASWDEDTFEDPIVAELDRYREQHAAQFNFDIDRIVADIRSREPQALKSPNKKLPWLLAIKRNKQAAKCAVVLALIVLPKILLTVIDRARRVYLPVSSSL